MAVTTTNKTTGRTRNLFYQAKSSYPGKFTAQTVADLINEETKTLAKKGAHLFRRKYTPSMVYNAIQESSSDEVIDNLLLSIISKAQKPALLP